MYGGVHAVTMGDVPSLTRFQSHPHEKFQMSQDDVPPPPLAPAVDPATDPVTLEVVQPKPWSFWATIGWGALGAILVVVAQTLLLIPFLFARVSKPTSAEFARVAEELAADGWVLSISTLVTALVVWLYLALLSRLRGWRMRDYLALRPLRWRSVLACTVVMLLFAVAADSLTYALGRDVVPEFMTDVFNSCRWPWLLFVALVVGAPVGEELMFRGFLYRGFAASLGVPAAIVLTSFGWAIIHMQYDSFGIGQIFLIGLIFGIVRHRTKSTTLTIVLHGVVNAVAFAEVVWFVQS